MVGRSSKINHEAHDNQTKNGENFNECKDWEDVISGRRKDDEVIILTEFEFSKVLDTSKVNKDNTQGHDSDEDGLVLFIWIPVRDDDRLNGVD
jgi:hypothetical protein